MSLDPLLKFTEKLGRNRIDVFFFFSFPLLCFLVSSSKGESKLKEQIADHKHKARSQNITSSSIQNFLVFAILKLTIG